jgi:hypothetical protein
MSIKVGAKVTWRHGKSKPGGEGVRVSSGVANCTVIERDAADDGRARIRLPPIFGNQEVKVLLADLEDAE